MVKQRISVRAIVQEDGKTLLLRRGNGRPSILGQLELPGGKLGYSEQPEDALRRYLYDDAGLHIKNAHLFDAVTYIDRDNNNLQYLVLIYNVSLATSSRDIRLSKNYDKYQWSSPAKISRSSITDLTQLLLGIIQQEELTGEIQYLASDDKNTTPDVVTIFTDGGSRGNPGPSAAGYVMIGADQRVVDQGGEYLGITNNNVAEYEAVRLGLEKALAKGIRQIHFKLDSMLVVNQMRGLYRVKNRELWPIHERIRILMKNFEKVTFSHVQREFNQLADGMVNKTLDQQLETTTKLADPVA